MAIPRNFDPHLAHAFYFMRRGILSSIKKFASSLGGKLLDFGCGSKPYKSLFLAEEYIGLDFDNPGHYHGNEDIDVFYDGANIPFPDNYFDNILCSEVIEHVFDLVTTLSEMRRVLKKGGKILVTCPFVWNEHEQPYDYARYTQFALKHLFEKEGFEIIHYEKSGNFVEALTQLRIVYFLHWASPRFSRFILSNYLLLKLPIFLMNIWGKMKSQILPARFDLYLSNVLLVQKR